MTELTWTSPIVEELSVPGGTLGGNPDADDTGADDCNGSLTVLRIDKLARGRACRSTAVAARL